MDDPCALESGDALAARVVQTMYARDFAAQSLGIAILETAVGYARVRMTVREDMLNGHGSAHGGFVFALADAAFGYACNSRNRVNVALQCSISFVAPAAAGDVLIATAREEARSRRSGVYDVRVENESGAAVAFFRGIPYQLDRATV